MKAISKQTRAIIDIIKSIPNYSIEIFIDESCGNLPNNQIDTAEALKILKVSRTMLNNYVNNKKITRYKARNGKKPMYNRYEINNFRKAK